MSSTSSTLSTNTSKILKGNDVICRTKPYYGYNHHCMDTDEFSYVIENGETYVAIKIY